MPHLPNRTDESATRPLGDRAERVEATHIRHTPHPPETTRDVQIVRAGQTRSEALNDACLEIARLTSSVISDRLEREDFTATNEGIARPLGVHEKQVRQYRAGEKRWPMGALLLLPLWLVDAVIDEVRLRRHRTPDAIAGVAALRCALKRLDDVEPASLTDAERRALVTELGTALGRVGALLGQLSKGGA